MNPTSWILPLDSPQATLAAAGGKGANLALLVRPGFPVPPGFIATTAVYRAFVDYHQLYPFIVSQLQELAPDDPAALETISQAIRDQFSQGKIPAELADLICQAYATLGRPAVAVRSSSTAEDLPDMSFAGQQDTFLNMMDEDALLKAVVDCWSSLWTARAIGYRARNAIAHHDVALAVVVQAMVQSEASGVLFTANPLNGRRTEFVVEATLGLGEALVSGLVEPDHYLVEAATGRIREKRLGAKATIIEGQAGGGTVSRSQVAADRAAVPDAVIVDLVELGRRVQDAFGRPQDIEWAWADEQLFLLQSRPITSLFPLPAGMPPDPLRVMFSFGAVQGMLAPMTPMGQDTAKGIVAGAAGLFGFQLTVESQKVVYTAAERLFFDFSALARNRIGRKVFGAFLSMIMPGASQALDSLRDDPRLQASGGLSLSGLRRLLPVLMPALVRLPYTFMRPDVERCKLQHQAAERLAQYQTRVQKTRNLTQRLALIDAAWKEAFRFILPQFVARFGAGMGALTRLRNWAKSVPDGDQDVWAITRGLPHNVTTEMDLALWAAAQTVREEPVARTCFQEADPAALAADYLAGRLPPTAQAAVQDFMAQYGMRGVAEIDLGRPRWRENPTQIMSTLQSFLRIEDPDQAPDVVFERGQAEAQAAIERLVIKFAQTRGGRIRAKLVPFMARRVRALVGLREMPKFWAIRVMGLVRGMLLESGQELVAAGVLSAADDVVFLHLGELEALAAGDERDWKAWVQTRRETYARELRRVQIPRLLLSDGQAFYEGVMPAETDEEGTIVGSPVSPGVVEGVVRVVLNPHESQLEPGEIMVCPGTDPAWTPLFLVAAGLVMEVGGLMTHGSVVAREYGLPAVVCVNQATSRLQTGQLVRVDGTAGRVTVLD